MLGEVPRGLPLPAVPLSRVQMSNAVLPLAMACFLLAAVETSAIGRMFAARHGYRLDATQEFLAIGAANLAAGVGSGFPVSGGMSQSLVNDTRRCPHAAVGPYCRDHHAARGALPDGTAAHAPAAGARGDHPRCRHRARRRAQAARALAIQPDRVRGRRSGVPGCSRIRAPAGRVDWRGDLDVPTHSPRSAAARRGSGTRSRHLLLRRPHASSGKRAGARRARGQAGGIASLLQLAARPRSRARTRRPRARHLRGW